jgi:hypothetical protein
MNEFDFSAYGQDLFLSVSEEMLEDSPPTQSQNNCASCPFKGFGI